KYVQSQIAQFAPVFSYDRAGYGWSDESRQPRTCDEIVKELHSLLQKANVPPPYILVGHSFGGAIIRQYACHFPDEVVGLVLVDSVHELQAQKLPPPTLACMKLPASLRLLQQYCGLNRLLRQLQYPSDAHSALVSTTKCYRTKAAELEFFPLSMQTLLESQKGYANKPLVVITAGIGIDATAMGQTKEWGKKYDTVWSELQADLVKQSTCGKQLIAEKSDHMIPNKQPEIIVQAVQDLNCSNQKK
ncbi:MAG TPA: alpha/beta hydrolase, partial [Chlamydiales bacterium]|nr:alpha/beta hydrolase [Chlamydiales bacterium]